MPAIVPAGEGPEIAVQLCWMCYHQYLFRFSRFNETLLVLATLLFGRGKFRNLQAGEILAAVH